MVLERSEAPVDVGSGITLFPNAMAALDAIGVGDAVRAVGVAPPAGSGGLRSPSGLVLVDAGSMPAVQVCTRSTGPTSSGEAGPRGWSGSRDVRVGWHRPMAG